MENPGRQSARERQETSATRPTPVALMKRRARLPGPPWLWWVGSAVALVVIVSGLTQALLAHGESRLADHAHAQQTAQATPQYTADVSAVAMTSDTDAWAFGTWGQSFNGPIRGNATPSGCQVCLLLLHYDGHAWSRVQPDPSLAGISVRVTSVTMLSPSEGWAVGGNNVLQYTNGAWKLATTVPTDAQVYDSLTGIAMISSSEGWAIGSQSNPNTGDSPLLLHDLHGAWSSVHLPAFDDLRTTVQSISVRPSGEGWLVGGDYTDAGQRTIVEHLRGGVWSAEPTGVDAQLNGVYAVSRTEAWAVGTKDIAVGPGVILHYLKGKWTSVPSPTPNLLHTVMMRSPTEGWIGGDGAATLRYDGSAWTKVGMVIHGFELVSLAFGGTEGWGAGFYGGQPAQSPLLLHYSAGEWTSYPLHLTLP
ncbi:MAG TPA: hypothetical protein VF120_15960 [Ktedonobacterales bacterium]